ncbi:LysM peptidoglycan-binding domain-containing protein [Alkalihalobacillus deserti]|uniref:LysM peptidoglycan-binding domain-containing protein n=1 Tax=Alkalihalobacillus deserti TaxID=2879466 RepID=UPI001D139DBE|nr:LysM peptidoglycan-binding domain-containing protein [Alkalihalobacillus deserti]
MKKSIRSLVTVAALTGILGFGFSASAEEVTVQKGDTLWGIANKHHLSVEELKEWNELSSNLIFPDDRLKIAATETYQVQTGDTLLGIAAKFEGVTWKMIQDWNQIDNPELIVTGQSLDIYINGKPSVASVTTKEEQVEVKSTKAVSSAKKTTEEPSQQQEPATEVAEPSKEAVTQELTMSATAYTASCSGCSGVTATGINLINNPNKKVISVDPSVIPLGSKVYVEGYGHAIAGDTGGAIVGNKIDLFIPNKQDANNWGVRDVKVTVFK